MEWDALKLRLKGNWNEIKGKIKQEYAQFTDDDLQWVDGKEDELFGRIQEGTGKSAMEFQQWMKSL